MPVLSLRASAYKEPTWGFTIKAIELPFFAHQSIVFVNVDDNFTGSIIETRKIVNDTAVVLFGSAKEALIDKYSEKVEENNEQQEDTEWFGMNTGVLITLIGIIILLVFGKIH